MALGDCQKPHFPVGFWTDKIFIPVGHSGIIAYDTDNVHDGPDHVGSEFDVGQTVIFVKSFPDVVFAVPHELVGICEEFCRLSKQEEGFLIALCLEFQESTAEKDGTLTAEVMDG